jgi:hypothetical protein
MFYLTFPNFKLKTIYVSSLQELALDSDMAIPTNNGDPPNILLKKGQQVKQILN